MSLGERIARLRGEKNLSQGELAERLGVSRQSVSKWETDGSVPELEKLMGLSEVFGVSLDELVKGEAPPSPAPEAAVPAGERRGWEKRKVAGTVLLCMAFLVVLLCALVGGLLEGLLLCLPFLLCGAVCFLCRHPGLGCGWTLYLLADLYLRCAAGLNWRLVRLTLVYEPEMNYMRLATAWAELLLALTLVAVTAIRLGGEERQITRRGVVLLAVGWILTAAGQAVWLLLWKPAMNGAFLFTLDCALLDGAQFILIALLLACLLRRRRSQRLK